MIGAAAVSFTDGRAFAGAGGAGGRRRLLARFTSRLRSRLAACDSVAWDRGRQEGRREGRQKGRQEGRQEGRLGTIENFLRAGVEWSVITEATGIDQEAFRTLRRGLEESESDDRQSDASASSDN